jgi:Leucine-rich repeat (LRR) protein
VEEIASRVQSLYNAGALEVFDDETSAESMALEWIATLDNLYLCSYSADLLQRYILAAMYFSLGGDSWVACTVQECSGNTFLSAVPACTWNGVVCSEDEVVELHLNARNITGILPEIIGLLTSLEVIAMDDNELSGPIPESLGDLSYLRVVDLDNNELTGSIPESLYNATLLEVIDLDSNELTGTLSSRVGELTNLYFLQLDKNSMVGVLPDELGNLDSLRYLSLFQNNFTTPLASGLCEASIQIYADCDVCTIEDCCQACLR